MQTFIIELIRRWGGKQPWFFKVMMYLSLLISFVSGLPGLIDHMCTNMEICITLPVGWTLIYNKVIAVAGLAGAFVSKLTLTNDVKTAKSIVD